MSCFSRTLRNCGFFKAEQQLGIEADDLIKRLDQGIHRPLKISDFFPISILNPLWTLIQGKRLDPDDPQMLKLIEAMDHLLIDFGKSAGQIGITSPTVMRIVEWLGLTRFHESFEIIFSHLDPVIAWHKETLDPKLPPRDFIDQFLLEIQVTRHFILERCAKSF